MLFHSCLKLQNAFSRNKCPTFKSGAKFEIKGETFSRKFFVNIFQLMPMKIKSTRKTCYPHTGYIFQYTKLPYGNVRRIAAQIQDAIAIWVNLDGWQLSSLKTTMTKAMMMRTTRICLWNEEFLECLWD